MTFLPYMWASMTFWPKFNTARRHFESYWVAWPLIRDVNLFNETSGRVTWALGTRLRRGILLRLVNINNLKLAGNLKPSWYNIAYSWLVQLQIACMCFVFMSRRKQNKCTSVLYSLLYGSALFSPVHCFEFMFILLQILCLLPEIWAGKNTSCGTCLKAAFRKVVKCAYFLKSTGSKIVVGPEIFHWCDIERSFAIPDAQHNKYTLSANITTHFRQEHQNLLSNCSFNSLSSLLSSSVTSPTRTGSKW